MSPPAHSSDNPNTYIANKKRELLNQFSRAAWGHPEIFMMKITSPEAGDIEFIDLHEYFPTIQPLFNSIMKKPTILVRSEYHVALGALQGDEYSYGAFVIGQPGIGKKNTLPHLPHRALSRPKRAIALQLQLRTQPFYALFSSEGVDIYPADDVDPLLEHSSPVWMLCDSNQEILIPYPGFTRHPDHVRVIQTTSPKYSRWKEWSKQAGACRFVMDVWSSEEVKKLAVLLRLNVERMTKLAEMLGGVPRTLLHFCSRPDNMVETKYRRMASQAIRECGTMPMKAQLCDLPDSAPSSFYFIRPRTIREDDPCVVVPTQTLCNFLAEGLQQETQAIKLQFFAALSQPAETRQTAGYIYESWVHSFLSAENEEIWCHWIGSRSRDGTMEKLSSAPIVTLTTQLTFSTTTRPFYWVPCNRNFPGIDSALLSENEIFAIQITIAKTHRSSPALGLSRLQELLPDELKKLSWNLVFVGDNEDRIQSIARKYAGKIVFPERKIRVGWSVVDPMREQVIFKPIYENFDPLAEELMEVDSDELQ